MAISAKGEMALLLDTHPAGTWVNVGTLARAPIAGGAPRPVLEDVEWADWGPDSTNLAVIRNVNGRDRLEYPIGKVLYETGGGWLSYPRVSPDGTHVAFFDHPNQGDDAGALAVVDTSGNKKTLTRQWYGTEGLAWTPDGAEIWFTASELGLFHYISATTLSKQQRLVTRVPGSLIIFDIGKDGRVLLARQDRRREVMGLAPGAAKERDLSWLDLSSGFIGRRQDSAVRRGGHRQRRAIRRRPRPNLRGLYPRHGRLTGGSYRRGRGRGTVTRQEVGHHLYTDFAGATAAAAYRRRRDQVADQRFDCASGCALASRRQALRLWWQRSWKRRALLYSGHIRRPA